jgi:chloramphenicol-sensitive protein RarD
VFEKSTLQGAYFALTAYLFWGVVPIYFKWVDHVSPWEILSHRVIWALILLLCILAYTGELGKLRVESRQIKTLVATAILLSINWAVFIYAVVNKNIVETSLGYFITPLVSVLLGVLVLKEVLRPLQWLAIVIAMLGILGQLIMFESIPWIALSLAFSFGFYGLLRKNLNLHSIAGLALETMIVAPFGLVFLIWLANSGDMAFTHDSISTDGLLILGGFVTSFPLLCFAAAVTRLSLTSIGMFQYIAPSLSLVIAVFMYDETFGLSRAIMFCCIWVALLIFSIETYYHHRRLYDSGIEAGIESGRGQEN